MCLPRAGLLSNDLWGLSLTTLEWTSIEVAPGGAGPSARNGHVMTSVGLDLWVHGGLTSPGDGKHMCNTRGAAAVAVLRQRVWLFAPSVTACAVVCVRLMTCVSPAGFSAELWRFSTSTRGWERVNSTAANGAGPSLHHHVMTSVGLDLWVHGGSTGGFGEGDACGTHVECGSLHLQ